MAVYSVTARMGDISFAPETEVDDILQCIRCILCTPKWSVPLDRDFGVDFSALDKPIEVAKALLSSEIVTAISEYEPRVEITEIDFTAEEDGILMPTVQVTISDDEEEED